MKKSRFLVSDMPKAIQISFKEGTKEYCERINNEYETLKHRLLELEQKMKNLDQIKKCDHEIEVIEEDSGYIIKQCIKCHFHYGYGLD